MTSPRSSDPGGMSAIRAAIREALHGPVPTPVGADHVAAAPNEHPARSCRGNGEPCDATAGHQHCTESCPSRVTGTR